VPGGASVEGERGGNPGVPYRRRSSIEIDLVEDVLIGGRGGEGGGGGCCACTGNDKCSQVEVCVRVCVSVCVCAI